ncbi:MAG: pyridoxal-5'-phosphate-dependent protein subunit beta [bacterium]|nr:pyridoxal-5'-phosphate-dependent protein subunit beta [bacterium]
MRRLGLERELVDRDVYGRAVGRFRDAGIVLPTFAELTDPSRISPRIREALRGVDPDAPHPLNLFRVHWFNGANRTDRVASPEHVVLPKALTGVDARIVVALGDRFPMIRAHKVLAAYGCIAPRIITGQFDPTAHRAVWPSTGNYARGGVAISRIMGCRGIAVLPQGMSRERFAWLERWIADPADIIRTPGTESNVKEIYDKCAELERDPTNIIFNQFCEFGNHLVHYLVTGKALGNLFESLAASEPGLRMRAFVSASGSAGTLGAGDYLKEQYGAKIVAMEALECPTMLYNGFGEHNIQGIGDKHIPLIHNVTNTDVVAAVSDQSTDRLDVLFNTPAGREYLVSRQGVPPAVIELLPALGLSSICNVLGAIKTAKHFGMGPTDVVITVATDGAAMYATEREKSLKKFYPGGFDAVAAGATFAGHLGSVTNDHLLDLTRVDRDRVFNLGYFTWVEQQGISIEEFEARRDQRFWQEMRSIIPAWDQMIEEFNGRTGAAA